MGFAITNKVMNQGPSWTAIGASTSVAQFASTTTTTSTSLGYSHQEFADYTTTGMIPLSTQVQAGSVGDFGTPRLQYRAYVDFKAYTLGLATATSTTASLPLTPIGPLMTLECATSTGYQPLYTIDWKYLPNIAGTTSTALSSTSTGSVNVGGPSTILWGMVPNINGCQFARVNFYPVSTGVAAAQSSSTQVDVIIEGL